MPTFDDGESGSSVRTKINNAITAIDGLGSSGNVTITGGTITGITDLAVADGGTGASDASTARTNLGLGTIATQAANSVDIDGGEIDGATIGASAAATGAFTTLTTTGTANFGDKVTASKGATAQFRAIDIENNDITYSFYVDQDNANTDSFSVFDITNSQTAMRYFPGASGYWQFYANGSERMRIDSSGNVGIGTTSVDELLHLEKSSGTSRLKIENTGISGSDQSSLQLLTSNRNWQIVVKAGDNALQFYDGTANADRMRIDSSGNVGIGETSPATKLHVNSLTADTAATFESTDALVNVLLRDVNTTTGTTIGLRGQTDDLIVIAGGAERVRHISNGIVRPGADGTQDFGTASFRWQDIYATNGTIQTSDANEKQQVEGLSEVERRVAMASKGLLRKFKWNDAVEAKGESARWHFGIIAQELQAAFEAEGLDAGDYGLFINSEWWTAEVVTPAVEAKEAELDAEGNVIVPAVEAQPEATHTETYDSAEEAPEGAEHHSRMGVRYAELLAFIIAAM